ncbi:MAG: glycine zipper domain-containing protein [Phycisphaerales bacterium]|nr:glycine zipper domain-containing protein [Phycisphaerales bacterium]
MNRISRTSRACAVSLLCGALLATGCRDDAQTGALVGAGGGALAGQAIGGNTKSTLIGAGAGAVAGYIIGNEMDKDKERKERERHHHHHDGNHNHDHNHDHDDN